MQLLAIELSKERLRRARNSLASYNGATNFDEAHDAWTNFLVAASGVYAKLEQGSKVNNKSTDWFNQKKNERKNDPMLQYLHQARNADEHGLLRVARNDLAEGFNKTLKFNERIPITVQPLSGDGKTPKGQPMEAVIAGPSARLVEVKNFGRMYAPPAEHLGKPLPYGLDFPDAVMQAAIVYLEALIAEAEGLVI
jgi:hypothetical protein